MQVVVRKGGVQDSSSCARLKRVSARPFFGNGQCRGPVKVHAFSVVSLDCRLSAKADITINILVCDYKKD